MASRRARPPRGRAPRAQPQPPPFAVGGGTAPAMAASGVAASGAPPSTAGAAALVTNRPRTRTLPVASSSEN
jgi:hypothetical protein